MNIRLKPLAVLLPLAFASHALMAQESTLDPVVVTATRFAEADPKIAGNITVLTSRDLRDIPATTLPDVLQTIAGVRSSSLYGALGIDADVDMRGFGTTATSNTLILVDGMRMNPVDMGSIMWASIPLQNIERIEVIRGAGSVLYGDGATGGVINIITNKSAKPRASVSITAGSRQFQAIDGEFGGGSGNVYANLFVHAADTEGYRQNAQQSQQNASGRVGALFAQGEVFADYAIYSESAGLPGYRLSEAYRNNPQGTSTPNDHQERNGYRLRPGFSYRLGDKLSLEGEVGIIHQESDSSYVSSGYFTNRVRDTTSFTPRLRWQHGLGNLASETVLGFDYYDSDVTSTNRGGANQSGAQTSSAVYFQNITALNSKINLTLGARQQRVEQSAIQEAYADPYYPSERMEGSGKRNRNAYDIGLNYVEDNWRIYGKTGTTFRFANVDELFGADAFGRPVFAGDLRPQHGTISEIGGQICGSTTSARASFYRLDLTDEIGYDGALFANTNFAPTRRDGLELEGDWKAASNLTLKAGYAYIDAKFREGSYAGKEVPLVPHHQGNVQAIWNAGSAGTYSAIVRYTSDRRFGSDFSNSQGYLNGYTTLDLQASWDFKPILVTAKVINATNEKYSPFAGYSSWRNDTYYYPADGRAFFLTGRYNF